MQPTERFSNRVDNYRRYRPSYPPEVIDFIRTIAELAPGAPVADVGSGTGILSRLMLEAGWDVYAIEPNAAMRAAAEDELATFATFHSVAAPAEATSLPAASMDAVACAQSFHWFDRDAAKAEFHRILRTDGWVFVIWNQRTRETPFDRGYYDIIASLGHAYDGVRNRDDENDLPTFFRPRTYLEADYPNPSPLDWEALRGRFLSSSYVPAEGDPRQPELLARLERLFHEHERDGQIVLGQRAHVYAGHV
ncbi:MAG: class I SAM-dependent methyltransferase [Verrucomicrobiota bacterium]